MSRALDDMYPIVPMHAYLYSVRGGNIIEDEGEIQVRVGLSRSVFFGKESRRRIYCAPYPGEVYNGTVWFDKKGMRGVAMAKLAEYERDRIFELSKQLRSHEQKLSLILGSKCKKG